MVLSVEIIASLRCLHAAGVSGVTVGPMVSLGLDINTLEYSRVEITHRLPGSLGPGTLPENYKKAVILGGGRGLFFLFYHFALMCCGLCTLRFYVCFQGYSDCHVQHGLQPVPPGLTNVLA